MVMVSIIGQIKTFTQDNFKTEFEKETENGQDIADKYFRVNIKMIREMGMVFTNGQMEMYTKVNLLMT